MYFLGIVMLLKILIFGICWCVFFYVDDGYGFLLLFYFFEY